MKLQQKHFNEIEKELMNSVQPSVYLKKLLNQEWFRKPPFYSLYRLKQTEQSPVYHPEGDVFNHTMMVVDQAAKVKQQSNAPRAFMWGALLHDIGKPETTKVRKGRITSYNHDQAGASAAYEFLSHFTQDEEFIKKVCAYVRWHMMILYITKDLSFGNKEEMLAEIDPKEIGLLGWCDRTGRANADPEQEHKAIEEFYRKLNV